MSAEQFDAALPDGTLVVVYLSAGCLTVLDRRGRTVLVAQRAAIDAWRGPVEAIFAALLGARPPAGRVNARAKRPLPRAELPALPGAGRAPTTAG